MATIETWCTRTLLTGGVAVQVKGTGIFRITSTGLSDIQTSDSSNGTFTNDFSVNAGDAKDRVLNPNIWLKPTANCYIQLVIEHP
jgi:hypothetical protein